MHEDGINMHMIFTPRPRRKSVKKKAWDASKLLASVSGIAWAANTVKKGALKRNLSINIPSHCFHDILSLCTKIAPWPESGC